MWHGPAYVRTRLLYESKIMDEITRILEKLETASNLGKSGALNEKEMDALRGYVRAAKHLEALAADCAKALATAAEYAIQKRVG